MLAHTPLQWPTEPKAEAVNVKVSAIKLAKIKLYFFLKIIGIAN